MWVREGGKRDLERRVDWHDAVWSAEEGASPAPQVAVSRGLRGEGEVSYVGREAEDPSDGQVLEVEMMDLGGRKLNDERRIFRSQAP